MENSQNPEQPRSIGEKRNVRLGINESEAKVNDIIPPSLPSKERQQNVLQANRGLGESTSPVLGEQKEIGANIEIPERPTPNLIIASEEDKPTLELTNDNIQPKFKEVQTDRKKEEATSEDWSRKIWEKIAFNSPDNLYFKPNILEKWGNGRIYELLGVRLFKRLYDRHWFAKVENYSSIASKNPNRKSALMDFEKKQET